MAVYRYLNEPEVVSRIDDVANAVRRELRLWERVSAPANGIVAHWDENYPDYFRQVSLFSRNWVTARLNEIRMAFQPANAPARFSVLVEVQRLLDQVADMQYAFES
jgi:chitinase